MEFWLKLWPVLLALVGLIGGGAVLKADVDGIKAQLPPGSIAVITYKVDALAATVEKEAAARDKMLDVMRQGQEKLDSLVDLLKKGKK